MSLTSEKTMWVSIPDREQHVQRPGGEHCKLFSASRAALSGRTFWHNGNVLHLC